MGLPWSMMLDVAYVGNHGFNRVRAFQGGANGAVDLNAIDIGAAYLPQNQDPTLGPSAVPGASAYSSNLLRAFRGFSNINEQETKYWDEYHSIQMSLNRRLRNGLAFGTNYTLGLSFKGNTGLQMRRQHAADGTISIRPDQAAYETLNENLALQKHVIKSYAVWDIPGARSGWGKIAEILLSDWQLSGVLTAGSAYQPGFTQANGSAQANNQGNGRYDLTYTYQNNGAAVNLTGSPDYARIVYVGDPDPAARQLMGSSTRAVPVRPNSVGPVGRFIPGGCPDHTVDMALANFRVGGAFRSSSGSTLQRLNTVIYNDRREIPEPDGPGRSSTTQSGGRFVDPAR
jgi:hypothetical protein